MFNKRETLRCEVTKVSYVICLSVQNCEPHFARESLAETGIHCARTMQIAASRYLELSYQKGIHVASSKRPDAGVEGVLFDMPTSKVDTPAQPTRMNPARLNGRILLHLCLSIRTSTFLASL